MPSWLLEIIIGGVVMGLIGLVYRNATERLRNMEKWKEGIPTTEEILTKSTHSDICHDRTKELTDFIAKQGDDLKAHFSLKVENVILTELKKINGGK